MGRLSRSLRHLFAASAARRLTAQGLARIGEAIAAGERRHAGEVVFAVETALAPGAVLRGIEPRTRAHDVFGRLRVWDTEANNGVLLYLLLADHAIEIVADRGLAGRVGDAEWAAVCRAVEAGIARDGIEPAVVEGVRQISDLLARHFPADGSGRDELPDRPVLL